MKIHSYQGYDDMTLYVEETPWYRKLFRLGSTINQYRGSEHVWLDVKAKALVSGKKAEALRNLWVSARAESKQKIRTLRNRNVSAGR